MDTQRLIALIVFSASGFFLWEAWQKHNHPPVSSATAITAPAAASKNGSITGANASAVPVPTATGSAPAVAGGVPTPPMLPGAPVASSGKRISVVTDTLNVTLDTQGADIHSVALLKHTAHGDKTKQFMLMQEKASAYFVTQSGLLGDGLPNHTANWALAGDKSDVNNNAKFDLGSSDKLEITFTNNDVPNVTANKTYTFKRNSYVVDVRYDIRNNSAGAINPSAYFQFVRDANPPEGESSGSNPFTGISTFTGPAVYTEAKKFQKIAFSDIDKNKTDYPKDASEGWVAMVQHYFVSAWLPAANVKRETFTKKVTDKLYSAGLIVPVGAIAAGASAALNVPLYMGPQEQENLKTLAPGLDLVVDYGWLHILAYPMFVVLSWIHNIVGNWGWTIIIFTILIKLVFFPLNQKAGKSMAHMKQMAPKIEAMKARYGDDKLKMNQAMMEMYKTEKINPLGGCLPILIQMPFFIALYWVLLSAVELRNAPWMGWITDLSTPDPFYVLPIIMGASMFIQTKLQPAPPDPVQAKVMTIMPLVFSAMFFFFPSGLVLYWTMQNILTIGQQWYINKTIGVPITAKAAKR
jgi:YidC/Oxa1 family membrane protein insertase